MQSVGISNKRNIVSLSVMVNFSPFAQYKASVVLLLPIEEVLEEIDEGWLVQDTLLGEQMEDWTWRVGGWIVTRRTGNGEGVAIRVSLVALYYNILCCGMVW